MILSYTGFVIGLLVPPALVAPLDGCDATGRQTGAPRC